MSSNISTLGINANYPIAGQDNDTQGFRDNFTNIKYNLNTAAVEITALQAAVGTLNTDIYANSNVATYLTSYTGNITANVVTLGTVLQLGTVSNAHIANIAPVNGMLVYNTDYHKFQGYANGAWGNITLS